MAAGCFWFRGAKKRCGCNLSRSLFNRWSCFSGCLLFSSSFLARNILRKRLTSLKPIVSLNCSHGSSRGLQQRSTKSRSALLNCQRLCFLIRLVLNAETMTQIATRPILLCMLSLRKLCCDHMRDTALAGKKIFRNFTNHLRILIKFDTYPGVPQVLLLVQSRAFFSESRFATWHPNIPKP